MTPTNEQVQEVKTILTDFVDSLHRHVSDQDRFEDLIAGRATLTTADLGSEPESWTEDVLINPILDHVEPTRIPGRPSSGRQTPDFQLEVGGDLTLIGESKSINKVNEAERDLIQDYISRKSWPDYGVATDGIDWIIYQAEAGGDFYQYTAVEAVTLRAAVAECAYERGYTTEEAEENGREAIASLLRVFTTSDLKTLLKKRAPQRLREQRKEDVEEFFDLYIGLIFGRGSRSRYSTCLRDDIIAPSKATQKEQDVFAVTLVNRLLFIKMLESRGVLPDGFLSQRVADYQEGLPSTLYEAVVKPLFYDLLNTPLEDRRDDQRSGWFAEVPYLNGGLFRPNVPHEPKYNVLDRNLRRVIDDLVEGYELDLDFDPKILGSVFEKTINYISEEENRQQSMGAYYTPDDVTRLIVQQTVDRKVKDVLLKEFARVSRDSDAMREQQQPRPLREILRSIEDGEEPFANREGLEQSIASIKRLKILDPACGSGHFLTAALEELYQVLMSLLRGYSDSGEPSRERAFEEKKVLALNCIYGVDIDPVAVEIAKLRVWLKIVEEGWEQSHGRLPNIDFNIVTGNSLIGLPVVDDHQYRIEDQAINDLIQKRREYKYDDTGTKEEIEAEIARISTSLDDNYLERTEALLAQPIGSAEELGDLVERLGSVRIYPTFRSVKISRSDGEDFDDEDRDHLESLGWRVYTKSARLRVDQWVEGQRAANNHSSEELVESFRTELTRLFLRGMSIEALEREVVPEDLDQMPGQVFHWPARFPEALPRDRTDSPKFDVLLGNPPYGDVLAQIEKSLLSNFQTSSISDIAAPFLERSLQLIKDDGYYGNIITLRFVYQKSAKVVRTLMKEELDQVRIACFTTRPEQIFEGAEARSGIVTGRPNTDKASTGTIYTSQFIRFTKDTRDEELANITYESTEGLTLGEKIGSGEDYSLPKVGNSTIRSILLKLKEASSITIRDWRIEDVEDTQEPTFRMWRRRGCRYWMNPMFENLYQDEETPTSMYPLDFTSDLRRKWTFLIMQSSLYYLYWMVYKNERNIDWLEVDAFPVISENTLDKHRQEINELTANLWEGMKDRFRGEQQEVFSNIAELKPLVDKIDNMIGPVYGLIDEETEYVKHYEPGRQLSDV